MMASLPSSEERLSGTQKTMRAFLGKRLPIPLYFKMNGERTIYPHKAGE